MTWTRRVALTLGLTAAMYGGSMAAPAADAEAHYLYLDSASEALYGRPGDSDVKIKWDRLEAAFTIDIVSSAVHSRIRNGDHWVYTVIRFTRANSSTIDRGFNSHLEVGDSHIYDEANEPY